VIFSEYIVTLISLLLQTVGGFAFVSPVVIAHNILVSGDRFVRLRELNVYRGHSENL